MRQVAISRWPVISFPATIVAWEGLKNQRDSGVDPVLSKKQEKIAVQASIEKQKSEKAESAYSVRVLCDEYLALQYITNDMPNKFVMPN